jgi:hypothetical protein
MSQFCGPPTSLKWANGRHALAELNFLFPQNFNSSIYSHVYHAVRHPPQHCNQLDDMRVVCCVAGDPANSVLIRFRDVPWTYFVVRQFFGHVNYSMHRTCGTSYGLLIKRVMARGDATRPLKVAAARVYGLGRPNLNLIKLGLSA